MAPSTALRLETGALDLQGRHVHECRLLFSVEQKSLSSVLPTPPQFIHVAPVLRVYTAAVEVHVVAPAAVTETWVGEQVAVAWAGALVGQTSSGTRLMEVRVRDWTAGGAGALRVPLVVPVEGEIPYEQIPEGLALRWILHTHGGRPRRHGSVDWPGLSWRWVQNDSRTISDDAPAAMQAAAEDWRQLLDGAELVWVLANPRHRPGLAFVVSHVSIPRALRPAQRRGRWPE